MDQLPLASSLPDDALIPSWLILAWLAILGGVVGSFVNVIVYRAPRGMSLAHPGSHCPQCLHRIRWHDNVPVFGWLWLRGRCRDCQARISARYPLVEAAFSILFAGLVFVEVFSAPAEAWRRELSVPVSASWATYGYHLLLLSVLLIAALIEFDRFTPPWKMLLAGIAVGFCAPLVWPAMRSIVWFDSARSAQGAFGAAWIGVAGAVWGLCLGGLSWPAVAAMSRRVTDRTAAVLALTMVGTFLGWQPITLVALVAMVLLCPMAIISAGWLPSMDRVGYCCALATATILLVFAWPYREGLPLWDYRGVGPQLALALSLLAALSLATRFGVLRLRRRRDLQTRKR